MTPAKANVREGGLGHLTPVSRYHSGVSPYGVYDMCGKGLLTVPLSVIADIGSMLGVRVGLADLGWCGPLSVGAVARVRVSPPAAMGRRSTVFSGDSGIRW
jgi:hypothetical protein